LSYRQKRKKIASKKANNNGRQLKIVNICPIEAEEIGRYLWVNTDSDNSWYSEGPMDRVFSCH